MKAHLKGIYSSNEDDPSIKEAFPPMSKKITKHTAAGIPTWSPTVVLICRSTAYVWQSGRDAQFSADCGRMCLIGELVTIQLS
jgi:hypothetical protein